MQTNFIKKAVREVLTSDKAGGHIILVTQGDAKTLSSAGEASIEEYEATHGITFSSILLPLVPEQKPLPFYQSIADRWLFKYSLETKIILLFP